jgi:hypothetical protein
MNTRTHLRETAERLAETLNLDVDDGCVVAILEDAFPECLDGESWPIAFRLADGSISESADLCDAEAILLRRNGVEVTVVYDPERYRWHVIGS